MGAAIKIAQLLSNLFDFIGFTVQGTAGQQKHAVSTPAFGLRLDRLGGGLAKNHFLHPREIDLALLHECVSAIGLEGNDETATCATRF